MKTIASSKVLFNSKELKMQWPEDRQGAPEEAWLFFSCNLGTNMDKRHQEWQVSALKQRYQFASLPVYLFF